MLSLILVLGFPNIKSSELKKYILHKGRVPLWWGRGVHQNLKKIFSIKGGRRGGVVAIDCNLQCYPRHTELHLFQAADLPLLFGLPPPSPDEPDQQQMNYYLLCVILAGAREGKVEPDLWVAMATGDSVSGSRD